MARVRESAGELALAAVEYERVADEADSSEARAEALGAGGDLGGWLRGLGIVALVDGVIYTHGGVTPSFARLGVDGANDLAAEFIRRKIREVVDDPETAEKLCPKDHPWGSKRPPIDTDYYVTYNRENVALVDLREDPIEEFTPSSVRTKHGEHPIDMLVLATGFDAVSGSMLKLNPKGRGGVSLQEKWDARFDNYLGMTIAGYPNLFMIHGPGSPGVFFTMPLGAERQTAWIDSCIRHLEKTGQGAMEATPDAEAEWDREVNGIADRTLYPLADSWYMGANIPGKPRQFLGHLRGSQYFDRLLEVAEAGYEGFVFEPDREGGASTRA